MKDYLGGRPTLSGVMVKAKRSYVPHEHPLSYVDVTQYSLVVSSLMPAVDNTEPSKKLKSEYETLKSRCQEFNERHQELQSKKHEADGALERLMNYQGVFGFQDEVKRLAEMKRFPAEAQPILQFAYSHLLRAADWGDSKLKTELESVEKQYPKFFEKYLKREYAPKSKLNTVQ